MDFSAINWLAVIACVVFSMISGSLWFGPKTFFPVWWKAIGKRDDQGPSSSTPPALVWTLVVVSSILQAVFMALMVNTLGKVMPGGATLVSGAVAGFVIWLGFVGPASLSNKLFADQLKAWALENGNHLINYVVFGAILGAWH